MATKISMKITIFSKIVEKREKRKKSPFLVDLVTGCERAIFSLWSHQMMHFTRLGRHKSTCSILSHWFSVNFFDWRRRQKKIFFQWKFQNLLSTILGPLFSHIFLGLIDKKQEQEFHTSLQLSKEYLEKKIRRFSRKMVWRIFWPLPPDTVFP